jgi:hypothetical protein
MRKISFAVVATALILIGFGVWVGAWTTARALAANTGVDAPVLTSGNNTPTSQYKDLPTSHYDDYTTIFPVITGP